MNKRSDLSKARRIVIKAGTSVVANPDGRFSLVRIGGIVEQIAQLQQQGYEVILISSGAVGCGRMHLRKQALLTSNFREQMGSNAPGPKNSNTNDGTLSSNGYNSACAAAGQLGLMSLYETMFSQYDVGISQFLVTSLDDHLKYSIEEILAHGMVPIINENDAISGNRATEKNFPDNDALAAMVAGNLGADVLIILTDVEGLYDRPPTQHGATIIDTYVKSENDTDDVVFGEKSAQGRGGMSSKIDSALRALDEESVNAVVVASGARTGAILDVMAGRKVGTLFVEALDPVDAIYASAARAVDQAIGARSAARALQALSSDERSEVLRAVAKALRTNRDLILAANQLDLDAAAHTNLGGSLLQRLKLTDAKLQTLAEGFEQLAQSSEPLGKVLRKTEVADELMLTQITVPIGVLLIVFESRPDSLPQICALSLRSGNGLLLKGGKEAEHSNAALHRVVVDAVFEATNGRVSRDVIGLVTSRDEVGELLKLEDHIDLVIPRGGKALVEHVKNGTRIPVLGHADGICHVYVDKMADVDKAVAIAVDAKTDYPSACNACETLLFHKDTIADGSVHKVLMALRSAGVSIKAGPQAISLGLFAQEDAATSMSVEYGCLTCLVEVVDGVEEALDHIHSYGSSHTEVIVTEDKDIAELFLQRCDAACAFHNASSRFADGYRFGLGAEVGISTGRIHARGPVGVEGLLTTKWLLRSDAAVGDIVTAFNGENATRTYTHNHLII